LEDSVNEGVNARKDLKAVEVLNQIYKKPDGELILTYYFYNSEDLKKESKRRINDIVLDLLNIQKKNKTLKNIIFISESKLNTVMIDDLKKYKEKMNITMFMGDYLLFNCTKHFLVPKHHLMSEEEQKEFLKDNKEKNFLQRLPKIFDTDPVARYYGAVPGQMFKIIRESLQDDLLVRYSEFYRYVVPEVKK
jgi:DNA-directed RNA polymerase I, II, and III subunit RPABC1